MLSPKKPRTLAALAGLALTLTGLGQTTYTPIAGYVKLQAAAATSPTEPTFSFVSHSLAQQRKGSGVVTTGGTDFLTASASTWGVDDYAGINGPHFALMTSGSLEGQIYEIDSNSADTLTLATGSGDTSALQGDSFRVYQHNTIGSVFGTDPTPDGFIGGDNTSEANQVLFYDTASSSYKVYYYNDETNPFNPNEKIGWVSGTLNTVLADDTIIGPTQGFIILNRNDSGIYSKPVFGDVIDDDIAVRIAPDGYNLVTVPYPIDAGTTLGTSNLYPADPNDYDPGLHLKPGANTSEADVILVFNGSGYDSYFQNNNDGAPFGNFHVGWVSATNKSINAASTPISSGSIFILRQDNLALDWVFPSVLEE